MYPTVRNLYHFNPESCETGHRGHFQRHWQVVSNGQLPTPRRKILFIQGKEGSPFIRTAVKGIFFSLINITGSTTSVAVAQGLRKCYVKFTALFSSLLQ